MKSFQVQVIIGGNFEDLSIKARDEVEAIAKARQVVASTPSLVIFKHRYARFVI